MTGMFWKLTGFMSRMLEPDEREAVYGDFAESGETGAQALRGVLGLIIRRQAALWKDWRPWLALTGLVVPVGVLLGLIVADLTHGSAVYSWLYFNNWEWAYIRNAGFRYDFIDDIAAFLIASLTLACWSWTSGFVVGSLSRRAIVVNGILFCLVLFGEFLTVPVRYISEHDAVFSLMFYRVTFPLVLRTVLVFFPSLLGMRTGLRRPALPLLQTMLWAFVLLAMTFAATRAPINSTVFGWWHWRAGWQLQLRPLVVVLPIPT